MLGTLFPVIQQYLLIVFMLPLLYFFWIIKIILSPKSFAELIERYNDLDEYYISLLEVKKKGSEFAQVIESRLTEILKKKVIKIPLNTVVLKVFFTGIFLLELITIYVSMTGVSLQVVVFDRARYEAFAGEGINLGLKGETIPDSIYIIGKETLLSVPVRDREAYFHVPEVPGTYIIKCHTCSPSLLFVRKRPYIKSTLFIYENGSKGRKLSSTDYVLKGTKLLLKYSAHNTDSAIVFAGGVSNHGSVGTQVVYVHKNTKIFATLFIGHRKVDTLLYNIYVVRDLPPEVVILYPDNVINPVMSDSEKVVAYVHDDIGLSRAFAVLYGEGFKRLVFEKKYKGKLSDTLFITLYDVINPLREQATLRVIAEDAGGKEGYAEVIFKKPTYEERLKEFLSLRDSITGGSAADEGDLSNLDLKLKESQKLNAVEREKLKKELEKTISSVEKLQKNLSNVQRVVENLKEITQDQELMKTMEEFNRVFMEMLNTKMQDLLKKLQKRQVVDSLDSKKLAKYLDSLRKNRSEIIKELKKLKEFMEEIEKELGKEEFASRFENLLNREELLKKKTEFFKDTKSLSPEQTRLMHALDSLSSLSPSMWKKYGKEISSIKERMNNVKKSLRAGNKKAALKAESALLKSMSTLSKKMKRDLRQEREDRNRIALKKIKKLRYNILFLNLIEQPYMTKTEALLYRESLSLSLSITDSLDAITYVRLFKAIALLRMARDFVLSRPRLSYGLVNQALLDLREKQKSMLGGGGKGTKEELEQMLKKLLSRQSSLTKETGGVLPVPMPMTQGMRSLLSEYGRMQEELRKMAEKLSKMSGGKEGKELQAAIEEMKKAEKELKQGIPSQKTLEHQRKALRHLLTAYRSIRKKELSRKRISTPGRAFKPDIPEIPLELQLNLKVRELMYRSIQEGEFGNPFIREYINNLKKEYERNNKK